MPSYSFGPNLVQHPRRANSSRLNELQKSNLLVWRLVFNSLNFLQILHKPLCASGAWRHSHSITRFVSDCCDISEWYLRPLARTRVNTCLNVAPNSLMWWAERFSALLNSKAWSEIPRPLRYTLKDQNLDPIWICWTNKWWVMFLCMKRNAKIRTLQEKWHT